MGPKSPRAYLETELISQHIAPDLEASGPLASQISVRSVVNLRWGGVRQRWLAHSAQPPSIIGQEKPWPIHASGFVPVQHPAG